MLVLVCLDSSVGKGGGVYECRRLACVVVVPFYG